jgi:hypothetical protein
MQGEISRTWYYFCVRKQFHRDILACLLLYIFDCMILLLKFKILFLHGNS